MRWTLLPLLLATAVPAAEAPRPETPKAPRLEIDGERRLVLAGLPPILADDGVREHLRTGLTTSVYLRPGGRVAGGARIDVRFELWDEVFQLTVVDVGTAGAPAVRRAEAKTFDELLAWWRGLRLALADGARLPSPRPARLKVTADVVPFSQSEESDTRRWFSESIDRAAESGTGEVGRAGEQPADGLSRTFNLLLATSIRRRALASYSWTPNLPPDPGRRPEDPP